MHIIRILSKNIRQYTSMYPILGITGPRQSGKTTVLKEQFADYKYTNLELPADRKLAETDPEGFFAKYDGKLIIDEVQRVPELFSHLQVIVDENRQMGQFIISGSQSFGLLKSIKQSLAGRIALFELMPLDLRELQQAKLATSNYAEIATRGSYPAIYHRNIPSKVFYKNYLQTYIERDVPEILDIKDIDQFRSFIQLTAHRAGNLMNWNSLSREAGITFPTLKNWVSILESSYITFKLRPYYNSFSKRITKSPKIYFYDTGLLCHLLGIKTATDLIDSQYKGHIFENLIISEMIKSSLHKNERPEYYYWRDSNGNEVDLLTKESDKYKLYEIKSAMTVRQDQFKGLNYLKALITEDKVEKHLIYGGDQNYRFLDVNIHSWDRVPELV